MKTTTEVGRRSKAFQRVHSSKFAALWLALLAALGSGVGCGQTATNDGTGGHDGTGAANSSGGQDGTGAANGSDGQDGTGGTTTGTGPECYPCDADAECAAPLVCGKVSADDDGGFCVEATGATECCLGGANDGINVSLCFNVRGNLSESFACPSENPTPGTACELQEECDFLDGSCWCDAGTWECETCPDSAPAEGTSCPSCTTCRSSQLVACYFGPTECQCDDGSWTCQEFTCFSDEFTCSDGYCIDELWECDGEPDCVDGGDEEDCYEGCAPGDAECDDGSCIDSASICDGEADCDGAEDEDNCEYGECTFGDFHCDDGSCVDSDSVCDGEADCDEGEDEEVCESDCEDDYFDCGDGSCIPNESVCDEADDCDNGADEDGCPPCSGCGGASDP